VALTAVAASSPAAGGSPGAGARDARRPAAGRVLFATSGNRSELRETVPIARRKWAKKRVVMSLGPHKLPSLRAGDALRVSGEVQISNTCIAFGAPRCIGRHYRFSPREDARIVLANGRHVSGGKHADSIAEAHSLRCHQPLPDRNHHCVLVLHGKTVPRPSRLPCGAESCFLNLVLEADHRRARRGQVILLGADRPNGTVRQDKGRLNAVVLRGDPPRPASFRTRKLVSRSVPVAPVGERGKRVVYSQRVGHLRKGDVLEARARHLMTISSLPYSAFISTRMIVAGGRHEVVPSGTARRVSALNGQIVELNGFNCTHGPSAYQDPCASRKVGALRIRKNAVDRHGDPVRLYVNVVVGGKAKRTDANAGDRMRALRGGSLRVRRYRAP
jgi:hypothetical protein